MRFVYWFKLGAWTLFALLGPLCFLLMHLPLGMAVTSAISVLIGAAMREYPRELRLALAGQGLVFGAYGTYLLTRPPAPWVHVAGSTSTSVALDPESGTAYGAEFTEHDAGFYVRDGGAWKRERFPAYLSVRIAAHRGMVLAHEDRSPTLWLRGADARWRRLEGQRNTPTYASTELTLYAATSGSLYRITAPDMRPATVTGVGEISTVCSDGESVLAVRSGGPGWRSDDASRFEPVANDQPATLCGLSADGHIWLAQPGAFSGSLSVSGQQRSLPAPRIEALSVNPEHGSEAWIGLWGAGVYRSEDDGAHWTFMGLEGFEVRSLAVDFTRHVAYAGTGSGVFERSY
jgi:hypothetical protein